MKASNRNYTLKDRYNFSASVRYDESSKFLGSNKGAAFWSAGVAWTISNEDFMSRFEKINQLKLRASYGTTGNQDGISDFGSFNGYTKTSYNGQSGYYQTYVNPYLNQTVLKFPTLSLHFPIYCDNSQIVRYKMFLYTH